MEPVIELTSAFLATVDKDPASHEKYGLSYYDDPRAQTLARIIETDLGVTEVRALGSGSFGTAAATAEEGGDVIKLTVDATEVESGTVLTNTKLDSYPANVVHVQGAWYVRRLRVVAHSWYEPKKETWHLAKKRIGILRMERVNPLNVQENFGAIQGLGEYVQYVKHRHKVWHHQTRRVSQEEARKRFLAAGTELEAMLMRVWNEQHVQIARDVARAIGQLRAIGIYGTDFHAENLGWAPSPQLSLPGVRENPVEETMEYRGHRFDLITTQEGEVYVRLYEQTWGPFGREEAITFVHTKIDERYGTAPPGSPLPPEPERPEPETEKIYKVFDIGMSSVGPGAPKPAEIGTRSKARSKTDENPYEPPILARSVKVAELG